MGYSTPLTIVILLSTLLFVYVGLTYMLTGYGFRFDVGSFLLSFSPYSYAAYGIAFSVGLSVLGSFSNKIYLLGVGGIKIKKFQNIRRSGGSFFDWHQHNR